jgi:hypothetical protein
MESCQVESFVGADGISLPSKMTISSSTLKEIDAALKEYCKEVLASELSAASQSIYIDHASNFVRWMNGDFDPGSRANPRPLKTKRDVQRSSTL